MRVIRAEVMGMCFGVRDALTVIEGIRDPHGVTILGQLVHNEVVLGDLRARGFAMQHENPRERAPALDSGNERVLITAHGISDRQRRLLESAGKTLIDTTCPLVVRLHQAAGALQAQGYHVLVIGRKQHVEVQGIIGDLTSVNVIESELDVTDYARPKLGVVCQTTATERHVAAIRSAIAARNPDAEIRYIDTICLPTKEHQRSLERLLERVDAVVVVGGRNSNNTRELVELCRLRGRPVVHVQSPSDLDPAWFKGFAAVGLTAGTSTLDRTIDEVHRALVWIDSCDSETVLGDFENQEALAGTAIGEGVAS
jgi:4-hydroxy-3-methylbut-2-enyl diphosphate reductase